MLVLTKQADAVSFRVKVAPRAARSAIGGTHDGALKVSLTAAPVDGEANAALCELLARALGIPKRAVQITHGQQARMKTVRVVGVEPALVQALATSSI